MAATFRPRDLHVYRPYRDEVPWDLLDADLEDAALDLNYLRVARHAGQLAGGYALRPLGSTRFELLALAVEDGLQHRGIGRWLLGHAIGLAETKGGREIVTRVPATARARALLRRVGFEDDPAGLCLRLTPE